MERQKDFFTSGNSYNGRMKMNRALLAAGTFGLVALTTIYIMFMKWSRRKDEEKDEIETKTSEKRLKKKTIQNSNLESNKRVKRGLPPGLINLGNTCFANCVLQAISSLPSFEEWVSKNSSASSKIILFPSVNNLIRVLVNKEGLDSDVFSAEDIIDSVRAHGWVITPEQQDAHEFYQVLMSTLDDELTNDDSSINTVLHSDSITSHRRIINTEAHNTIPVPRMMSCPSPFKGLLASRMTCVQCGYQLPVKFDPFESVSVRIPTMKLLISSIESCLFDFVKSETVHDVDCPGCTEKHHSKVTASFTKQLSLAKLPQCLCIQIQRTYMLSNGDSYKNCAFVKFSGLLDVTPFTYNTLAYSNKQKYIPTSSLPGLLTTSIPVPLRGGSSASVGTHTKTNRMARSLYRLNSVIVHIGEAADGHFVTYRRSLKEKSTDWTYTSDQLIRKADKTDVLSSIAYLLFYERIKT